MSAPVKWLPEQIAALRQFWREGQSTDEIARRLGTFTAKAVSLKAHGLGLPRRAEPGPPAVKRSAGITLPAIRGSSKEERFLSVPLLWGPARENCSLIDLRPDQCRWPVGRNPDATPSTLFCGKKRMRGFPYCEQHHAKAAPASPATRGNPDVVPQIAR